MAPENNCWKKIIRVVMNLAQKIEILELLNTENFVNIARVFNTNESSVQTNHSNGSKMRKSALYLGSHVKFFKISKPGKNLI